MAEQGFDFKEWYDANGEKLNKDRRTRYHTDPEYRKQVLAQNKASREKRREATAEQKGAERAARKFKAKTEPWKTVEITVKDKKRKPYQVTVFTVGALAAALGVSVQAVRLWERQGVIPKTPLRSGKGDRLYTVEQLEMMQELLKKQGKLDEDKLNETRVAREFLRKVKLSDGKVEEWVFVRVGVLATEIERGVITIDQLEARKLLPQTPFRASTRKYRLYTRAMVGVVKKAMEKRGETIRGAEQWAGFYEEVSAGWKKLGVDKGAKLLVE
jgi:DNA-binding transcriptional regulator YiaG